MSRKRTRGGSELVRLADLGRFLCQDADEVRLLVTDGMPHTKVNGRTRPVYRVFLPDFHRWLMLRSPGCERLADYQEFRRAFREAQTAPGIPDTGDGGWDD